MKTSNRSKFHQGGYAALLTTISLSLTIIAFAITAFRETRQATIVQTRNQVKLDYSQKEEAFLRALIHIVPNHAMRAMMDNSSQISNVLDWNAIFDEAMLQASIDQSLSPGAYNDLNISVTALSANPGDADFDPANFVESPNGSNRLVMTDDDNVRQTTQGVALDLPPQLNYYNGGTASKNTVPIINFNKRLSNTSPLYTQIPYPNIAFGLANQGSTFIAKRNWWAFTINFGSETAAITGIAATPRTYVLSIYEVPAQLAISSTGGTTSLGKFQGGASWNTNITIAGSIYAERGEVEDTGNVGVVASRQGVHLGGSAPTAQSTDLADLASRRNLRASTNTFHRFSSSSESGLVAFTPINRGTEFFDYFAGTTQNERSTGYYQPNRTNGGQTFWRDYFSGNFNQNNINNLNWDEYSLGARQTQIQVEVARTTGLTQLPDRLFITARFNGDNQSRRQRASRGSNQFWREGNEGPLTTPTSAWNTGSPSAANWFIQESVLPNGRPCLELDLEKLPAFLEGQRDAGGNIIPNTGIGADSVAINNSIWIGPNYGYNGVDQASYPSVATDTALYITKSTDLSAFTNGLTIITPYRVYFGDNFNDVPISPAPAGAILDDDGNWYPPVSIYAPEKRFGIQDTSGRIEVAGQVGYLPDNTNTATVNPLDFAEGGMDSVTPANISADLKGITQVEDLPPVSAMNWLTTIEEIRN